MTMKLINVGIRKSGPGGGWRCVVAGAMALTVIGVLGGCEEAESLVTVADERDANEILVELRNAGVEHATKTEVEAQRSVEWSVKVPALEAHHARSVLVERNLPRKRRGGLDRIAESGGIIPTQTDERAKLMLALSEEIEGMLEGIDGVIEAHATVVIPTPGPLDEPVIGATRASVVVRYDPGRVGTMSLLRQDTKNPIENREAAKSEHPGASSGSDGKEDGKTDLAKPGAQPATKAEDAEGHMRDLVSDCLRGLDGEVGVTVAFSRFNPSTEKVSSDEKSELVRLRRHKSALLVSTVALAVVSLGLGSLAVVYRGRGGPNRSAPSIDRQPSRE